MEEKQVSQGNQQNASPKNITSKKKFHMAPKIWIKITRWVHWSTKRLLKLKKVATSIKMGIDLLFGKYENYYLAKNENESSTNMCWEFAISNVS